MKDMSISMMPLGPMQWNMGQVSSQLPMTATVPFGTGPTQAPFLDEQSHSRCTLSSVMWAGRVTVSSKARVGYPVSSESYAGSTQWPCAPRGLRQMQDKRKNNNKGRGTRKGQELELKQKNKQRKGWNVR